jgi:hypothetical protein
LHPGKLAELKEKEILDKEAGGREDIEWRQWILMESAEEPNKGKKYSVNYKEARVDWQSPLERSPAKQKAEEKQNEAKAKIVINAT